MSYGSRILKRSDDQTYSILVARGHCGVGQCAQESCAWR
jgi:hypothetical protein